VKKAKKTKKSKSKYVERGVAIKVLEDDFFSSLAGAFRLHSPDISSDPKLLRMTANRLQILHGKTEHEDLNAALCKIREIQGKLDKAPNSIVTNALKLTESFALHKRRRITGLISFSAVDKDLAKQYRQLQTNAKVASPSKHQVAAILDLIRSLS